MNSEKQIVDYICHTKFKDLPDAAVDTVLKMLLADTGTTIAGAHADGCEELVSFYKRQGGRPEATVLMHGGKIPAHNAAFVNAVMSRALDFCDAIEPGAHIGSSTIPTGLACAELAGGCSGEELISALVVGTEIATRMNLSEAAYNGFDPTGICVPFGATAVACRLLGLDETQTLNALGLVFNRCGGSFQSNIDGTLAVRVIQGWVAQESLLSARHALLGLTGPENFLTGIYGYQHLYCHDRLSVADIIDGLGSDYRLLNMAFKKYPSCAMTSGPTEAILDILKENNLEPADIKNITVTLPPYGHRLVGHDFKIGDNPTVDGQFCAQYCIANVLLRGSSRIQHFTADFVRDPEIRKYIPRISVLEDSNLDLRGHTATDMEVTTREGRVYRRSMDVAPGFPGNSLTDEDHLQRFMDCVDFGAEWIKRSKIDEIQSFVRNITSVKDVRELVAFLTEVQDGVSVCTG